MTSKVDDVHHELSRGVDRPIAVLGHLVRWLSGPALDERFAGRIRKEQLGAILRLTPPMMLANLANGGILLYAFWDQGPRAFILTWFATLCMTIWLGIRAWSRSRRAPAPRTVSPRGLRRAIWHACTLGTVWAAVPVTLFAAAEGPQRVLLAALMTGMIAGGGFALSTVPPAALAYASVMILSSMFVLVMTGEPIYLMIAALLLTYGIIVGRSIFWHAGLFVERLENQFDLEHQRELIGILLRDFEESASDWLWETDDEGRLQHVSRRLADVMGRTEDRLQGRRFIDLLTSGKRRSSEDDNMLRGLLDCFERRSSFRDRVIDVSVGDGKRSWSLSAKPVYDFSGIFKGYRGVGTDVTDKIRAERQLAYLAHIDPLTDLANRSCLDARLAEAFKEFDAISEGFGLICLDLDGFKAVNDSFGHGAGDRLLELVGKRLKRCARGSDTVARIGGDEFAVLQKAADQPSAGLALAERIVRTLAAPFDIHGQRVVLGASVGVAIAGWDGDDPATLMRNADLALYRSKWGGRGRFLRYQPRMTKEAEEPRALERDLPMALARGEMDLRFQPIVRADLGDLVAVEALLVWRHRDRGMIPVADFLPRAEEAGLIVDLGAFVIDRLLTTARSWPDHLALAVNLSPAQLSDPAIRIVMQEAFARYGIKPERLEVEVSAEDFDQDSEELLDMLHRLRERKIRIALDQFGAGTSQFDHLCSFPFDRVRLDPLYIEGTGSSNDRATVLGAIIELARKLGMATTAAGVTTEAQLEQLRLERCGNVQGDLICRPRSAAEFTDFLNEWSGWPNSAATPVGVMAGEADAVTVGA